MKRLFRWEMKLMEKKAIIIFSELIHKAKNQDQADVAYAQTIKRCIDLMFSMNTLREITHLYSRYGSK